MLGAPYQDQFKTREDYENHPVGKHMLNMPWLWEPGEYPQKSEPEPYAAPAATHPETFTVAPRLPASFPQPQTRPDSLWVNPEVFRPDAASDTQAVARRIAKNLKQLTPRSEAFQAHRQKRLADIPLPEARPEEQTLSPPSPPVRPASHWPYPDMGETVKPVSDKAIDSVINPAITQFDRAVRNKQSVEPAEQDLVNMGGVITKAVRETYTRDNFTKAADAIHQGATQGMEAAYGHPPPNMEDMAASIHTGDTYGRERTMANPDLDALKGFKNSLRDGYLTLQEGRQLINRNLDPKGEYLDTRGLQRWIDAERQYRASNKVPGLEDFTKLDWRKDPDRFIELGGKYFRQSLLGTHLFGYAADVMKGNLWPVANQIIGTVTGIARIYAQSDDLLQAALRGAAVGSSVESWDFIVNRASQNLPFISRQGLRLLNSVLTREMKEQMFDMLMRDMKPDGKELNTSR